MQEPDDATVRINVGDVNLDGHEEHVDGVARLDQEGEAVREVSPSDQSSCPCPEGVGNLHLIRDDRPPRPVEDAIAGEISHQWPLRSAQSYPTEIPK